MRKRLLSVVLTLLFCLGASYTAFADIDYSQWDSQSVYPPDVKGTKIFTSVKYLVDKKIVTGDDDGLFHPEKNISRAEFATMMAKATNNDTNFAQLEKEEIFTDLDGYGWAKGYINGAYKADLINGIGGDKFAPGNEVTYAEVITILIRINKGAAVTAESMAPKWPDNYIMYAEIYNMKGDVVITDWNAPATKGDVAQLVYRRLPK